MAKHDVTTNQESAETAPPIHTLRQILQTGSPEWRRSLKRNFDQLSAEAAENVIIVKVIRGVSMADL